MLAEWQMPPRMPPSVPASSEPPKETGGMPPVRPTFPAYSAPTTDDDDLVTTTTAASAPTPVRKIEFAANSSSKLIHPDDDISLVM